MSPREEALERSQTTLATLRARRLHARTHALFGARRRWRLGRHYEYLWPFADAWSALCTLGSLPGQRDALDLLHDMPRGLAAYSREPGILEAADADAAGAARAAGFDSVVTPPLGGGGERYYDDNAWLGLALVRHHELDCNHDLLRLAQRVFAFVISGWSTDESWQQPGGIRWKEPASNRSRNTCANGPTAELAARLHEATGTPHYLDRALHIYDWTRRALLGPDDLYADQIAPDGSRNPTIWSYNQGTMIGAGVLLARQTGDPSFLDHAEATANTYVASRDADDLTTQDPAFNAIFFRNLLLLDDERPDDRYRSLPADYGATMWATKRLRHGYFAGQGSPLNNAAAMVQIYALVAGAPAHA